MLHSCSLMENSFTASNCSPNICKLIIEIVLSLLYFIIFHLFKIYHKYIQQICTNILIIKNIQLFVFPRDSLYSDKQSKLNSDYIDIHRQNDRQPNRMDVPPISVNINQDLKTTSSATIRGTVSVLPWTVSYEYTPADIPYTFTLSPSSILEAPSGST